MQTILIQLWEIPNNDETILPDGCSLHIDTESRDKYVIKNNNSNEKICGLPSDVEISDSLLNILIKNKNIRLSEIETNNLIGLKEIIPL